VKKKVILNSLANKELESFPLEVQAKFYDLFKILEKDGKLEMPFSKKIQQDLFEIRVKHRGQYRATYA
jgi:phage-related protein